jgi:autotransporter translocation and assembly factor TamB
MKQVVVLVLAALLLAAPVVAQDAQKTAKVDITGQWTMTADSPQGQMVLTATYKQDGETLTGTHVSEMGEAPLKGTVKGNEVVYTLTLDMGGQQFSIVHKGKVDGDTITGTAEIGEMGTITWTAKRKK